MQDLACADKRRITGRRVAKAYEGIANILAACTIDDALALELADVSHMRRETRTRVREKGCCEVSIVAVCPVMYFMNGASTRSQYALQ